MLHPAAARGFARSAADYERARPDYPPAAIAWLAELLDLRPGRTVLDLAAGTGKLTRALVATGAEVAAVEPLAEMRAAMGPDVRALDGAAEDIPLPDASMDACCVAQAFHWFDGDAALAEIHRVLRPAGALALVWNRRRLEDPIHAAIEDLIGPYRGDTPAHHSERWRGALRRTELFESLVEHEFANVQRLGAHGLAARVGSISFIAALPEAERAAVLERAGALAGGGEVELRYRCEAQVTRRRPASAGPPRR